MASCTSPPQRVRARYIRKVTEKDSYWWVECAGCSGCWQVPFFAEESVG
jgi:hypothetical protein